MKKSRYSDSQIMAILKQNESGVPVAVQRPGEWAAAPNSRWNQKTPGKLKILGVVFR